MWRLRAALPCVLLQLLCAALVTADERNNKYAIGDGVRLWVNKVGPYNNPQETYNYYFLPFCKPRPNEKIAQKWGGLGEVLQGNQLVDSQLDIKFRIDQAKSEVCTLQLDESTVKTFRQSVRKHYWYELFLDNLPIWGFVGPPPEKTKDDDVIYIYTHKKFEVSFNDNRIIQVNLTSESPQPLVPGSQLVFTYEAKWVPTDISFGRRFERYLDYNFFEHQIHWFSIFNSFMMVIFLTGLVSMILLRTLRRDYAKYTQEEDDLESLERDMGEETGWKLVHGDVFRPPRHLELLAALTGTGVQLATLATTVILVTIAGALFVERGTILTVWIVCYALTSVVGGYVSGGFYARHEGKQWIRTALLTANLFPVTCFALCAVLNTIAIFYRSLAAVPFGSIVVVLVIWFFVSFPLTLLGTVVGRNWNSVPNNPCRVKRIPSPIPYKKWYLQPWVIALVGGLLPFGSIFIEMYFIFTSFWQYKVYYVFGFMLLVFAILMIVTVCVTIVATYFLLNSENWMWQWASFGCGASTGIYIVLYSISYYFTKTKMSGMLQTSFFFGYTAMACLGLSITCGAVGHLGARLFVRKIFSNLKVE